MDVKIGRKAKRHLKERGGVATVDLVLNMGCLGVWEPMIRTGKPDDPSAYTEVRAGDLLFLVKAEASVDGERRPVDRIPVDRFKVDVVDGDLSVTPG